MTDENAPGQNEPSEAEPKPPKENIPPDEHQPSTGPPQEGAQPSEQDEPETPTASEEPPGASTVEPTPEPPSPPTREAGSESEVETDRGRKPRGWLGPVAGVAAVLTVVIAGADFLIGNNVLGRGDDELGKAEPRDAATIEVRGDSFVSNPGEVVREGEGASVRTKRSAPTVDIVLVNHESDPVRVTGSQIKIVDFARFAYCGVPGGGDAPTDRYLIRLPVSPLPEERLVKSASPNRTLAPGEPDEVSLAFATERHMALSRALYLLDVSLATTAQQRLTKSGRFMIALPDPYLRSGVYFPEDGDEFNNVRKQLGRAGRTQSAWCYRRNLSEMRRILRQRGKRAPEVAALSNVAVAPAWRRFRDAYPARSSALRLLKGQQAVPLLAAYAARSTGDLEFAADIERRAYDRLMGQTRRQLAEGTAELADDSVRAALELQRTQPALALLGRIREKLREQPKPQP